MNISILGAGAWGLAIAGLMEHKGNRVKLWEFDKKECLRLNRERTAERKLPGYRIPDDIEFTNDIKECIEHSEVIVNAVPTQFIRSYFSRIDSSDLLGKLIVNVSKGIEASTGMDIREMFLEEFDTVTDDNFVILAGPSFAYEVALNQTPTAVVAASKNIRSANRIRDIFSCEWFRVYSNDDVIGVETGGSVKNILAISAGVIDGLGLGNNTKAALLTRGLAEMIRFGLSLGAKRETFSGLSGIGDMVLTCNSNLSRNWQVGNRLAKGEKLEEILSDMSMIAEGVETTRIVKKLAADKNVSMPITFMVYDLLFNDIDPGIGITELMTRRKKRED